MTPDQAALTAEITRLRKRLREAEDLIDAIRNGRIDAVVVSKPGQEGIYTLQGADRTYRILIETMGEGAVILSGDATILYCNSSFARMLGMPLHHLTGTSVVDFIAVEDRQPFNAMQDRVFDGQSIRTEINLLSARKVEIPVLMSLRAFSMEGLDTACMVVTDLTRQKQTDASLAEKEVLLKEIHHRVKNNMQVISSLVDLQADEVEDPAMREVFKDVIHRVRSMALVHEKLYQASDLARIDFGDYAETLVRYLWRAHGTPGIQLHCDLEPIAFTINAAVPSGLILNELFTNALKHAFHGRAAGELHVSLRARDDDTVALSVRDNGVGLPDGFDWQTSRSLGLSIVRMLAGQLHAEVDVCRGEGTEFKITIERTRIWTKPRF